MSWPSWLSQCQQPGLRHDTPSPNSLWTRFLLLRHWESPVPHLTVSPPADSLCQWTLPFQSPVSISQQDHQILQSTNSRKKGSQRKQNAKIRIDHLKDTPIYKTEVAEKGIHHKKLLKIIRFVNTSERVRNKSGELSQKETKCKVDGKQKGGNPQKLEDQCRKSKIHMSGVPERIRE